MRPITGRIIRRTIPLTPNTGSSISTLSKMSSLTETPRYENGHAQNISRPNSALRGESGSQYGDQGQRQQAQKNASVVIKVGMVGDAQIGKTSLMVKYVEGSWDEDYIQTLGTLRRHQLGVNNEVLTKDRCELHGKDDQHTKHRNHILDLGSWWSARIRQYAAIGLQ